MAPTAAVELEDLQGNVLCGYSFPHARYVFVSIKNADAGRRLLQALTSRVISAVSWGDAPPAETLNLALTHEGLRALGVPDRLLRSFPCEFRAGMGKRAAKLCDVGESEIDRWEEQLKPNRLHLLVTMYAPHRERLQGARQALTDEIARAGDGVAVAYEVEAGLLGAGREHFGFSDGFSQPAIRDAVAGPTVGEGTPMRFGRWRDDAPGEFVLGYEDEDGQLPAAPKSPFDRNCSFMVVRKLQQHVDRFTNFLRHAAGNDRDRQRWIAARIVGRWDNGASLIRHPDHPPPDTPEATDINDFRYRSDHNGMRCPLGAHVRRVNPRDSLGWQGRLTKRHRIIRRGMPYGDPPADPAVDDRNERGLMFVCYQASIARQFEVIQSRWVNDGDAFGLRGDRDFLIGTGSPEGKMTIPGDPPTLLAPQPDFVTTRGGDYFFVPSVTALDRLGDGSLADGGTPSS
jgi:Dyp-type peroxidase family